MTDKKLLHETLTHDILACCFEVSNDLGCGYLESVYRNALSIALAERGISHQKEAALDVRFHGQVAGQFYADIVVEKSIILELKAVKSLVSEHFAQTLNYLHGTGIEVGLLVNFGKPKLEYRRLERRKSFNNVSLSSRSST